MSVKEYKAMGERLAKHLASKHGVKLKHTAIFEAMAAQFGFKDWNTLKASLEKNEGGSTPSVLPMTNGATYLVGHDGEEPCGLNYEDLRRHLLISGGRSSGVSTLHRTLLNQHIRNGGGFIFIDAFGEDYLARGFEGEFRRADRAEDYRILDFEDTSVPYSFNPLMQGSAADITNVALSRFRYPSSGYDESWHAFAWKTVHTLVSALLEAKRPVTFLSLFQLVQEFDVRAELLSSLPESSRASSALRELQQNSRSRTYASIIFIILTAITPLMRGNVGEVLDSTQNPIIIRDVIEKQQGLYIKLPVMRNSDEFHPVAQLVIRKILDAITANQDNPGTGKLRRPPFLVLMESVGAYWTSDMDALFAQGASANMGLVVTEQSLGLKEKYQETLLGQTWNKVILRQDTVDAAKLVSEIIGNEYRSSGTGRLQEIPRVPEHHLRHLHRGDAWFLQGPHSTKIRVAIQENAA